MNATEHAALLQGAAIYEEIAAGLDDRTLEILERRRRTARIRRRGWLVRRMLLAADLIGLVVAFVAAQLLIGVPDRLTSVDPRLEWILFFATLPVWVFAAKLYGLYERDEERTDHSTLDDLVDVFHLATVGSWALVMGGWLTGLAQPDFTKLVVFWVLAIALITGRARLGPRFRPAAHHLPSERGHRGRWRGRTARGAQASPASRVRHQPRRLRG